eukprot:scaffold65460_cov19-Tisochrysis_lutea.AAC.2
MEVLQAVLHAVYLGETVQTSPAGHMKLLVHTPIAPDSLLPKLFGLFCALPDQAHHIKHEQADQLQLSESFFECPDTLGQVSGAVSNRRRIQAELLSKLCKRCAGHAW